jgi:hypothetical protein
LQAIGDDCAATVSGFQQAFGYQLLNRLTQGRARNRQFQSQIAFGRQPVARLEGAFQYALLQVVGHSVGNAGYGRSGSVHDMELLV